MRSLKARLGRGDRRTCRNDSSPGFSPASPPPVHEELGVSLVQHRPNLCTCTTSHSSFGCEPATGVRLVSSSITAVKTESTERVLQEWNKNTEAQSTHYRPPNYRNTKIDSCQTWNSWNYSEEWLHLFLRTHDQTKRIALNARTFSVRTTKAIARRTCRRNAFEILWVLIVASQCPACPEMLDVAYPFLP